MRYKNTGKVKENGVVYTPTEIANYISEELIRINCPNNKKTISILDPAVGEGELLISIINTISENTSAKIEIVGYETDTEVCKRTQNRLQMLFPEINITIHNKDFLNAVFDNHTVLFDYIIANPPYIRTQILGSEKAQQLSKKFGLSGRIDAYYAFLLCVEMVLKSDGVAGFITSNKFLTIKSGESVRNFMLDNYLIHRITDLGDTKLFTASVLPCVLVFSKGKTTVAENVKFTSIYQCNDECIYEKVNNVFDAIYLQGHFETKDGIKYSVTQGSLKSVEKGSLWTVKSNESKEWLDRVESHTWQYFSDIGKIRVGIKTTADNVFIGDDWSGEKSDIELLQPLITHRNAGQILPNDSENWKVLYTHTSINGKKTALNIDDYPNARDYLKQHYEQLASRKYLTQAKRNWYEIWVPQNPDSWKHRKIVFRDISEHPQFWIDDSGAIVNGDCYWIDIYDYVLEDIIYLALAIANSTFIEKYYDLKFNTKLYSGKRRFMTQYVEQFPIPIYTSELAQSAIKIVKKIIAEKNQKVILNYKDKLNHMVDQMFA